MMRAVADADRCISSLQCSAVAPGVFGQDEDDIVVVLAEQVPAGEVEAAEHAVRICPSDALRLLATG